MSDDHEQSKQLHCDFAVARRDFKKDLSFSAKHRDGAGDRRSRVLVNRRTITDAGYDQRAAQAQQQPVAVCQPASGADRGSVISDVPQWLRHTFKTRICERGRPLCRSLSFG